MTIVLFLIILAALIFVHELGHFTAAKIFGIRVDEFAIGFPPRIFGWKRGETQYSINLIPFGGYVKIFGENPDDESLSGPDSSRSFVNAKKWKQIIVLFSGIFMNVVFAWILISISFNIGLLTSIEDQYKDKAENVSVTVLSVLKDSPAEKAGIKSGDEILGIKFGKEETVVSSVSQVQEIIINSPGKLNIEYRRDSATATVEVTATNGIVDNKKAIGISMGLVGIVKFGILESFYEGAKLTYLETKNIAKGIYLFIFGLISGKSGMFTEITGPVGIVGMVGQAKSMGLSYLFSFIAIISVNLAVLNAVPFPALDGGRVFFVFVEIIIRRKIKPAILNLANMIGFGLLITLMLFVTYKDILRLLK